MITLRECNCIMRNSVVASIPMKTVTEQLRHAVERCGVTRYRITQETGIPASVLSRFVTSGRGLRSENIDKLCAYLGLELRATGRDSRKGG